MTTVTEKLMDSSESTRVFAKDIIYYIAYAELSGRTQNRSEGCPPEEEDGDGWAEHGDSTTTTTKTA